METDHPKRICSFLKHCRCAKRLHVYNAKSMKLFYPLELQPTTKKFSELSKALEKCESIVDINKKLVVMWNLSKAFASLETETSLQASLELLIKIKTTSRDKDLHSKCVIICERIQLYLHLIDFELSFQLFKNQSLTLDLIIYQIAVEKRLFNYQILHLWSCDQTKDCIDLLSTLGHYTFVLFLLKLKNISIMHNGDDYVLLMMSLLLNDPINQQKYATSLGLEPNNPLDIINYGKQPLFFDLFNRKLLNKLTTKYYYIPTSMYGQLN